MSVVVDEVVSVMLNTGGEVIFREKTTIACNLEVPARVFNRWFTEPHLEDYDLFRNILETWVVKNGIEATIGRLTIIMINMKLLAIAEAISKLGNPETRVILTFNTQHLKDDTEKPLITTKPGVSNAKCYESNGSKRRCRKNLIIVGVFGIVLLVIMVAGLLLYNYLTPTPPPTPLTPPPTPPTPLPKDYSDAPDGFEADRLLALEESDQILYKDFKNIHTGLGNLCKIGTVGLKSTDLIVWKHHVHLIDWEYGPPYRYIVPYQIAPGTVITGVVAIDYSEDGSGANCDIRFTPGMNIEVELESTTYSGIHYTILVVGRNSTNCKTCSPQLPLPLPPLPPPPQPPPRYN